MYHLIVARRIKLDYSNFKFHFQIFPSNLIRYKSKIPRIIIEKGPGFHAF